MGCEALKMISIDDGRAVRDIRVVVVDDSSSAMPIEVPPMPAPAETSKDSDWEAESKTDSWSSDK